ncbi:D(1) dopamine receptor-like [Lampris incognitus]|uniref:D(1) dopamine receptor-like n=1 Tax=Lampris incognitus TaxID=2546036 RepID=UPI0024B4B3C6|nr:D(1) dopamine receptor-like [Lampris incognitus]
MTSWLTSKAPNLSLHLESAGRALVGSVLALLISWTFLGNFTVCAAIFRYRHLRAKVTNIFIASLALSDLLVAVLVMPWKAAAEVAGFWPFGAFCNTWVACDIMCSTASILNLCVISVDRYWAVSSPFRYERKMDRRVASVMLGVTWTVSVVISFVPVQLKWHRADVGDAPAAASSAAARNTTPSVRDGHCDPSLSRTYAISSSLISFYIPVAIMVATYTRIYRIAQVQIRRISTLERAAEHAQSCHSHYAPDSRPRLSASSCQRPCLRPCSHPHRRPSQPVHRALRVSIRRETKVVKTLSIIIGVFICCWSPFFVLNCAIPFCPGPESPNAQRGPYCVSKRTFDVFVWFGWSNSSLNPIIYAFNADFREAFLRLLGCRCTRCRGAGGAAVETVVASHDVGSLKQESPLHMETGACWSVNTRGSEDSGKTTVTLVYPRGAAALDQETDAEESKAGDVDRQTDTDTRMKSARLSVISGSSDMMAFMTGSERK